MNINPEQKPDIDDAGGVLSAGYQSMVKGLQFAFFALVVLIVGMLVWFFSFEGYFAVKAQEAVIVLRFGAYENTYRSGWYWFMPYPVSKFITVPTAPQSVDVNYLTTKLGGLDPTNKLYIPPMEPGVDNYLITADANIVHSSWKLTYSIVDPELYYRSVMTPASPTDPDEVFTLNGKTSTRGPQTLLRALLSNAVLEVTATMTIDDLLGKRDIYREQVQRNFEELLEKAAIGVELETLTLVTVEPPRKTIEAFQAATNAGSNRASMINQAEAERVDLLNRTESDCDMIIKTAQTEVSAMRAELKAESEAFLSFQEEYRKHPETFLTAFYTDTLTTVFDKINEKYIFDDNANHQELRVKVNQELDKKNNNTANSADGR